MTHLPPIKTDDRKETKEGEGNITHTQGTSMDLSSFLLVIRALEYGNRQQIHLQGRSLTANIHIFYPLSKTEYSSNSPRLDRPHTHTEKCCCVGIHSSQEDTHIRTSQKKATVYLTTYSFSSFPSSLKKKSKREKKGLSRGTIFLSLSLSTPDCFSMC